MNGAIGDLCGVRGPRRGCAFNGRFVGWVGAHFHAKRLTSEHLLLLNAFLSLEGRESCGVGRAHSEKRGPGLAGPGSQAPPCTVPPCADSPVEASRVPPGAGPHSRTQFLCGGAPGSLALRTPRLSQVVPTLLQLPCCCAPPG